MAAAAGFFAACREDAFDVGVDHDVAEEIGDEAVGFDAGADALGGEFRLQQRQLHHGPAERAEQRHAVDLRQQRAEREIEEVELDQRRRVAEQRDETRDAPAHGGDALCVLQSLLRRQRPHAA